MKKKNKNKNKQTNELSIYAILCQNFTISYREELASLFFIFKCRKNWKCAEIQNETSSCFIADDSHVKTLWLFTEHDNLDFWDDVCLWKCYQVKVSQNCFTSFYYSDQISMQADKFWFALDKQKNWFKVLANCQNKTLM